MKKCGLCNEDKEDLDFNQNQNWCKECQSILRSVGRYLIYDP